jgi:hypothetical protein
LWINKFTFKIFNFIHLGIPNDVQLIVELAKPPVDKLRLANHNNTDNPLASIRKHSSMLHMKRVNLKKLKPENEKKENTRDVEVSYIYNKFHNFHLISIILYNFH